MEECQIAKETALQSCLASTTLSFVVTIVQNMRITWKKGLIDDFLESRLLGQYSV